ncbi:hypothetical protein BGX34_011347 [Mortierella sp. NVP85]|nr:hypothetical protein BGX34_011347 [Mortierella sp. NVP85]
MSPRPQKTNPPKAKKAVGTEKAKKKSDQNEILLKEIMAMGGSEQDLELLKDIDSDSEIEGDNDQTKTQQTKNSERSKASKAGPTVEPELKNELASFMKSLFGSNKIDHKQVELASDEEGEEEEGSSTDQSGDGWETEEDVGDEEDKNQDEDDSGHDSMDDLPQELKDIHAQLESRKRKAESDVPTVSSDASKDAKRLKSEQRPSAPTPAKPSKSKKPLLVEEKNTLKDVQKQVSAILETHGQKGQKKQAKPTVTPSSTAATSAKGTTTSKAGVSKKKKPAMAWKLGDGWNKGFENEDDNTSVKTKRGTNVQKNKMKQAKPKGNRK